MMLRTGKGEGGTQTKGEGTGLYNHHCPQLDA